MHNRLVKAEAPPGGPASLASESWPLLHAHSLTVRPLRPDDADLLVRFGLALAPESRYQRFLGGGVRFTPELLERLLKVDFTRDLALVATVTLEGREVPVGIARYVRLPDDTTAELAMTVADAWHGCGIGRLLLERLVGLARERGVRRLVGDTLATNEPMLRLARSVGFAVHPHAEGATLKRIERDLEDEFAAFVGRTAPGTDTEA
jgi:acetyltransferase